MVCSEPTLLKHEEHELAFPWIPEFEFASYLPDVDHIGEYAQPRELHTVTFTDGSLDNRRLTGYARVFNVDLSNLPNTTATAGIIFEFPWINEKSRKVSGCVIDAR